MKAAEREEENTVAAADSGARGQNQIFIILGLPSGKI